MVVTKSSSNEWECASGDVGTLGDGRMKGVGGIPYAVAFCGLSWLCASHAWETSAFDIVRLASASAVLSRLAELGPDCRMPKLT